jgi:unsaturated rhamnogalacturonyl hydrolase
MKTLPFQPKLLLSIVLSAVAAAPMPSQANDVTMPLHELRPDYPTPYGAPSVPDVLRVLERVYGYLDAVTPAKAVDKNTGREVTDFSKANDDTVFAPADFRLTSYEWGVTYAGMLQAGSATGDQRYTEYVTKRLALLGGLAKPEAARLKANPGMKSPVRTMLQPHALDDIGAVCAAMIKARRAGYQGDLAPLLESCRKFITETEFRLPDGTLARNRPQPNTMWLDDMFMAVPALAQMGKLTGERKYFDDAVKQVQVYTERMFNPSVGLYQHGWVQAMDAKPQIRWARANGWAIMAKVELLDALPTDHPGRPFVLQQLRAHAKGLVGYQHGSGFWHQLIDRNDSYLETSATAIYAYSLARAINQGYLDKLSFAPATMLAWNAVATKVNAKGQVEGTCVGTGMGFEPAYYYYRPVNVFAAHGYGPVLLAGAEIVTLLKNNRFEINDSAFQLAPPKK